MLVDDQLSETTLVINIFSVIFLNLSSDLRKKLGTTNIELDLDIIIKCPFIF